MDSANKDLSHSLSKLNSNQLTLCQYRICPECGNDHGFSGDFDDTVTSIDMLPALFEDGYRSNFRIIEKLQELVN
jgi:hypothetical protein